MILERVFYIKKGSVIREHCIISLVFVWFRMNMAYESISHVHSEVKHLGYDKIFDKLSESIALVPYMYITKAVRKFVEACWYAKLVKELQVLNLFHCILYRRPWFHGTHCLEGENERKNKKKRVCKRYLWCFTKYVLLRLAAILDANNAVESLKEAINLFNLLKRVIADLGRCVV